MKKNKLILKSIGISLILLFIITSLIISKKHDTMSGFISAEKMKADYEYFWDFIYNGYPFTEVCERKGIDLKQIRQAGYKYLSDPMMQHGYYFFYYDLCRKITGNRYMGHLYPSDYFDYKKIFKKSRFSYLLYDQISLIDNFYASMSKTDAFSEKNNMLYADNKNINPPLMGDHKYSKPYTKIINTDYITYIKINSFLTIEVEESREYLKVLEDFFIETENYKHIIIDIQNNGGGYPSNYEAIIAPHIKKNARIFYYGLYNENKYTNPCLEVFFKYYKEIEKIEKHEVANVENSGSVKNDKGYRLKEVIATRPIMGYKPCTDKKFWVLISRDSYSAADMFADVCKRSGFATVVGENTGGSGVNAYWPMYTVLPNSGLLIKFDCMYGLTEDGYCVDEFGTAPDIYNLPGKNALETCLETIKNLERKN